MRKAAFALVLLRKEFFSFFTLWPHFMGKAMRQQKNILTISSHNVKVPVTGE
jgi:hypothetical protein